MRSLWLIIRGIIIGFVSYQVLWLIYLYLRPKPDLNSGMHITMVGFTIEYYEFVIPVAVIAMATRKYFSLDKPWLYDIYEGLTISAIYVGGTFGLHIFNLIVGRLVSDEWMDPYFNFLPEMKPQTILSFLAIPLVVLFIRNLIEKPYFKRLES